MRTRTLWWMAVAGMLAALLPTAVAAAPGGQGGNWGVEVVSSPAEYVSGGDARLLVDVPPGQIDRVLITVNGRDVTGSFEPRDDDTLEGVVDGLSEGDNQVEVRNRNSRGAAKASVTLTNHPITGPIFSGPQQEPFSCSVASDLTGAELDPSEEEDCSIETVVSFKYRTTSGSWADYDPDDPPDDVDQTTTLDGETVDYIVRWERGTINRFVYSIAMLSPESQEVDSPDLSAWNDRLIYHFQGGVGIGHYQGDPSRSRMLYEYGLANGYAVAYSTGTKTGEHYNLEVGGETAIMVKDRFVSAYGLPDYTVGIGASGGAIQQYVYGQNHKGLIDAAIPVYSYPDMITQTIHVGDCELLERWMDMEVVRDGDPTWADWENRTLLEGFNAINGFDNQYAEAMPPGIPPGSSECVNGWRGLSPLALNPHFGTAPGITPEQQEAIEWTHYGDAVNIYGVNEDGFANRTWDNVGVQYGLAALVDGQIAIDQFLDLNANVGSWKNEPDMVQEGCPFIPAACPGDVSGLEPFPDIWPDLIDVWSWRNMALSPDDGATPAPRATADPGAVEAAYERGLVFTGDMEIPIIDWRNYLERELDMHNSHQSFAARQRLLDHDDDASNQVIWFTDGNDDGGEFDQTPRAFQVIDEWMANLEANPRRSVAENKPQMAVDSCFDADGNLIYSGEDAWDGVLGDAPDGPCTEEFPIYSTSRIEAGGPITGDVFKCELQPVEEAVAGGVYGDVDFTTAELDRLKEVFPQGVCDYTQGDARRP